MIFHDFSSSFFIFHFFIGYKESESYFSSRSKSEWGCDRGRFGRFKPLPRPGPVHPSFLWQSGQHSRWPAARDLGWTTRSNAKRDSYATQSGSHFFTFSFTFHISNYLITILQNANVKLRNGFWSRMLACQVDFNDTINNGYFWFSVSKFCRILEFLLEFWVIFTELQFFQLW